MIRRNPHVFGDVEETDPARINETWEAVKAAEKQRDGLFDGIPLDAARADPRRQGARPARARRRRRCPRADPDDLGDRLLALVAEARAAGEDPEQALRDAVRRAGA